MVHAIMRKHQKVIWTAIAVVVVITFVFWGVASGPSSGRSASDSAGTLYGKSVKAQVFLDSYRAVAMLYGPQLERSDQGRMYQELEAWRRIILLRKLDQWNVHVSDDDLVRYIQSLPWFQTNGQFDRLKYGEFVQRSLPAQGLKETDFERIMRDQLRLAKLELIVGATAKVTPAELRSIYNVTHEKIDTSVVLFDAADLTNSVKHTDAELADYFEKNKEAFRIPERRRVRYVRFAIAAFTNEFKVTDAELKEMFEKNKERFVDEKGAPRTFESIQADLRKQMIDERAFQRASELGTELALDIVKPADASKEPDFTKVDFAALAKKYNATPSETAFFEPRGSITNLEAGAAFNQAAFALTLKEPFSDAVGCADGVYVLQLLETKPSELPTLDPVKDRVVRRFTIQRALDTARTKGREAARNVKNAVMAAVATKKPEPGKDEIAKLFAAECAKLGLKVSNPPPLSQRTEEAADIPEFETLIQTTFGMRAGEVSDFIDTMRGGLFVLVKDRIAPTDAEFDKDGKEFGSRVLAQKRQNVFGEWAGREIEAANPPILARLRQVQQQQMQQQQMPQPGQMQQVPVPQS